MKTVKIPRTLFLLLLHAVTEATRHTHQFDTEIEASVEVLENLSAIIANHPETQVADYYCGELERMVRDDQDTGG